MLENGRDGRGSTRLGTLRISLNMRDIAMRANNIGVCVVCSGYSCGFNVGNERVDQRVCLPDLHAHAHSHTMHDHGGDASVAWGLANVV